MYMYCGFTGMESMQDMDMDVINLTFMRLRNIGHYSE